MKLYTHLSVDLDAVCSVWAARQFIPGAADAELVFVPANWDGANMADDDIAVDIPAGGRGIKGEQGDNVVHSCFKTLVAEYASTTVQAALSHLVRFVDAQDSTGNAVAALLPELDAATQTTLQATGLNAVLRALQAVDRRDAVVVTKMSEILDGLLASARARQRAEIEADMADCVGDGRVALVHDAKEFATNSILFDRGVVAIVYTDGNNLGVVCSRHCEVRADHPAIRKVVEAAGELPEWFAHPAGFLFCRGSRKSPATTASCVQPQSLAETVGLIVSGWAVTVGSR